MLASELPAWITRLAAFVLGATWGSFFNVAIHRWPRELSVVSPPSHCPACKAPIPAWRNVPIVGYLVLRGRAACCGTRLSPRYLFVELLSGVIAIAIAERWIVRADGDAQLGPLAVEAALWFAFAGGLLIASFVDLEWMEIPDEVSVGGTALGLATASLRSGVPLEEIVLGAGAGYLTVQLLLVWSWERLTGQRGMGEGDSKLAMYIGAFLGWRGALFALVAGAFQGIVAYAIARAAGARIGPAPSADHPRDADVAAAAEPSAKGAEPAGDEPAAPADDDAPEADVAREADAEPDEPADRPKIPFGPFLALGAIEFLFFGNAIVDWYLSLFE